MGNSNWNYNMGPVWGEITTPGGGADPNYSHPMFGQVPLATFTDVTDPDGQMRAGLRSSIDQAPLEALRARARNPLQPGFNEAAQMANVAGMYRMQDASKQRRKALSRPGSIQNRMETMEQTAPLRTQAAMGQMGNLYDAYKQSGRQYAQEMMAQPGREMAALQPQMYNIKNAMDEAALADQTRLSNWMEQQKAYAGAKTGNAYIESGRNPGILGMFGL